MKGFVDELNQPFLTLDFGQGELDFLVDTGFIGTLVVGEELFDASNAASAGYVEAELAAGQLYTFACHFVEFEWFGKMTRIRILLAPGTECLLGSQLLAPNRLEIDYEQRSVTLTQRLI
ncbi:MAG: hypothetical protein O3C40_33315 [Planctomycetota bacterium]|nr:hypothetical protein [Planctomycetota bacterium]